MNAEHQQKWDHRMLDMARLVAGWSKDPGTKVGAVLARGNRVLSVGYNGLPRQLPDTGLDDRPSKLSRTIHAELNAIFNSYARPEGATLYVTPLQPCDRCAVHVIQAGIVRVVAGMYVEATNNSERLREWAALANLSSEYFRQSGVRFDVVSMSEVNL